MFFAKERTTSLHLPLCKLSTVHSLQLLVHIFHLLFIQVCLQHINHHPNLTIIIVNVEQCFCQIFVTGVNSQTFSHTNTPSLW